MTDPILTLMARLLVAYRKGTGSRIDPHEIKLLARTEPFASSIRNAAARAERLRMEVLAHTREEKLKSLTELPTVQAEAAKRKAGKKLVASQITIRMAKAIREARQAGATYPEIAKLFNVSIETARRHACEINAKRMRENERKRHRRLYEDPACAEQLEKKRQKGREYYARQRARLSEMTSQSAGQ